MTPPTKDDALKALEYMYSLLMDTDHDVPIGIHECYETIRTLLQQPTSDEVVMRREDLDLILRYFRAKHPSDISLTAEKALSILETALGEKK